MNPVAIALSELAEINPKSDIGNLHQDSFVSFIPMSDVSESGQWFGYQERKLKAVRNGYTAFSEGDLLFAKITPCMENGKGAHVTGLKNGIGFGSTEFHVLRARGENSPRFLYHWLQAIPTRIRALAFMGGSAGQQRVQADFFANYHVPFIEPPEQFRIAYVLDTIDDAIAKTEAVIAKLKQVRAGLLHDLLSYGLDKHGQLRDPVAHPEQIKDSPLGRIPRGWDVEIIGQLPISIIDGDRGSNYPSEAHLFNQGYCVFLNNKNIKDGIFDFSFAQFITKERDALLRKGKLQLGDIVITTRGTVGNIALFKNIDPYEHIRINSGMIILRSYEDRFKAEFFVEVWQHLFPSEYRRLSSGSAQPQFPIRDMQGFRLIIPPKPEQERIARFLSRSHLAIDQHKTELDKLTKVKSGLMNDVLNGRVRVPETIAGGTEGL